jgi:diketogulonate reductase-like aldo/keto reductase
MFSYIILRILYMIPKWAIKATYNHAEKCQESVRSSLRQLKVEYLDMVLIHWPGVKGKRLNDPKNAQARMQTWLELETLQSEGLIRSIGVSNYNTRQLEELLSYARIKPSLLQVDETIAFIFFIFVVVGVVEL